MAHSSVYGLPWSGDVRQFTPEFLEVALVDAALARVGLSREEAVWPDLFVPAGTTLALPRQSALFISTDHVAMYKRWIGIADDDIALGLRKGTDERPQSADDVETAACAYLWGLSSEVEGWREAIERAYAPFTTHVATFGTIHLAEGAELRVDDVPAVVIAQRLILDGGSVTISTAAHFTIGELVNRR